LPAYVDDQTLVVASSFSGTSEETLAAVAEARAARSQVAVITAGGPLLALARTEQLPHIELPGGIQGRYGVLSGVKAWVVLAAALGIGEGWTAELAAAVAAVRVDVQAWSEESPTSVNEAKRLARVLLGHAVVIYAGPSLAAVAMKWKVDCNENAKQVAYWNVLPEMNHNELSGWGYPVEHGFRVVELVSDADHPQVGKRYEVMNRLLSNRWQPVIVRVPPGSAVQQMLWSFMLGGFMSAYLAILNQVEIQTLPLVDRLKSQLD
jgi:glucose/mannose-6-phosphate isomerase